MADMNEMIQALGPGLGHMLAIQQQRNSQNQVQAQTGATLESTLRSQQQRRFDGEKHPLTLEEMMLRNKDKSLENQVAQRKWNIESATPEADVIAEQGYKTQAGIQERMIKNMPGIIATANAIPDTVAAREYVQQSMLKLGADKNMVAQFHRFDNKDDMIKALTDSIGRIQGEATPNVYKSLYAADTKAATTQATTEANNATKIKIQEMKSQIEREKINLKVRMAGAGIVKLPKNLEGLLVADENALRAAEASGNEQNIAQAQARYKNTLEALTALVDRKAKAGVDLGSSGQIEKRPTGPNAPMPVRAPTVQTQPLQPPVAPKQDINSLLDKYAPQKK